jgi:methanethiol S-methyltransferase
MPAVVWDDTSSVGRVALETLFWLGWATVQAATFMINHFDLFGLRQVYLAWRGKPYTHLGFRTSLLYRLVRQPIMLGFIIAFGATPEDDGRPSALRDSHHGLHPDRRATAGTRPGAAVNEYREYRHRVPMLVPRPRRRREATALGW